MIATIFFCSLAAALIASIAAAFNMAGMLERPGSGLELDRFSGGFKRHAALGMIASISMLSTLGSGIWWLVDTYATKS